MEWQMSGGETSNTATPNSRAEEGLDMAVSGEGGRGPPTEKEEIRLLLDEGGEEAELEPDGEAEGEHLQGSKTQEVVESAVQKGAKK
jgi:hypothetical protein